MIDNGKYSEKTNTQLDIVVRMLLIGLVITASIMVFRSNLPEMVQITSITFLFVGACILGSSIHNKLRYKKIVKKEVKVNTFVTIRHKAIA